MFSSAAKPSDENRNNGDTRSSMDLSLRMDYYGGDFVEDGSFLVLNTDGMSLSPSTPPADQPKNGEENNTEIEVLNEVEDDETQFSSINHSSIQQQQVLGEDPESSVDSNHSMTLQQSNEKESLNAQQDVIVNSNTGTNVSVASSGSTETYLLESSEELNLVMTKNMELTKLLAETNEKMLEVVATTNKLTTDHEEYKRKSDTSREVISQLRQENDLLKSQILTIQSQSNASDGRLDNTVLTYNGKLNDELLTSQKTNEELRTELEKIQSEKDIAVKQIGTMREEIEAGRKTVAKFNEHQLKVETELTNAQAQIGDLEAIVEEKTKLTDSLRKNMEDTVTALERRNEKLNQKEQEVSLLTTKLAALNAETECSDRLQALEMQCQNYRVELQEVREERAKLTAEKDALLGELNARNDELKEISDRFDIYRRQHGPDYVHRGDMRRNDNSADNANESLPSPLTSLPSVAGQLVGFVRRELLGWEDQSTDTNRSTSEGATASATVVQQPKQEAIPPCPICKKTFGSLERLQTHASNCGIENDDEQPEDPFVFP